MPDELVKEQEQGQEAETTTLRVVVAAGSIADATDLARDLSPYAAVTTAVNPDELEMELAAHHPHVLISEIDLGLVDARDLYTRTGVFARVPVIFYSARSLPADIIEGLDLGAADYVVRPVRPDVLAARARAAHRARAGLAVTRHTTPSTTLLSFEGLVIDEVAHEVLVSGEPVVLSRQEFNLLAYLAHHPQRAFTRAGLYAALWPNHDPGHDGDATVTEHVRRLRTKIELDPNQPRWIITVRGVGYRFERRATPRVPVLAPRRPALPSLAH